MNKPFPHQEDAIQCVLTSLKTNDRCHIVMACGTGKTLTTLWIAERLRAKTIAIFLPSLALINQFMKEWLKHTTLKSPRILAICSDDTVTNDVEHESLLDEEITFPVSNNSLDIQDFLEKKTNAIKLIFCTYQSAWILGNACHSGIKLDLGIFDEAHKTAGYGKDLFAYPLHDANLKIKKRLFVTATPRHASVGRKDKDGEFIPLYSMDDESLYGPRAYTLDFREAIDKDLICDYKIIISVADISQHKFNDAYEMQEKAIALKNAVNDTKSRKIITYHKSINDAGRFANYLKTSNVMHTHKPLHVNGLQKLDVRADIMHKFRTKGESIICNAKCLTEGVDVPSVDMVAFLNPKTSKIDIVQAIGRALRKYPGKKRGYIFLPVFLDNSLEDVDQAISESNFSHIWEVLNALSERDSDLNDVIKAIGAPGDALQSNAIDDYVEFHLSKDKYTKLKELISIKILEKFQKQNSRWDHDDLYNKLVVYKIFHGSFTGLRSKNMRLYKYIQYMKDCYILGSHKRFTDRLITLGIKLQKENIDLDAVWESKYQQLLEYKKKHGTTIIPQRSGPLGRWCADQRENYKEGKLSSERLDKLNKIKFVFDLIEHEWHEKFTKYKYKTNHNIEAGREITDWVAYQRKCFALGKLSPDRIQKLMAINFDFGSEIDKAKYIKKPRGPQGPLDNKSFLALKTYYDLHGNILVVARKNAALYKYMARIRKKYKEGKIDPILKKALDSMGFNWEGLKKFDGPKTHITITWQKDIDDLHRALTKDLKLLPKHIELCKKMYVSKYKSRLSAYRKSYLESINFPWDLAKDAIIKSQRTIKYKRDKENAQH